MQTIIIVLDPAKLENPDLDLRYRIPDRIDEVSNGLIKDNGYDYIYTEEGTSGPLLGIWLKTEKAGDHWPIITKLFQEEKFMENDLFLSAQIYISENENETLENCDFVFPK